MTPIEAAEAVLPGDIDALIVAVQKAAEDYGRTGHNSAEAYMRLAVSDLRDALRAALPALREVPAGWKLVPVEPTLGMLAAAVAGADAHLLSGEGFSTAEESAAGINGAVYRAMLAAAPPAPSVREVEPVAFSARPLEWDLHESGQQWTDKHHGFCILIEPEEADAYCASWGEGDAEQFKTLEQAMAWCQRELDAWVRRYVVADPPAPAQPAQGGGDPLDLYRQACNVADWASAAGTPLENPQALYEAAAKLRDTIGRMKVGATPAPAAPDEPGAGVVEADVLLRVIQRLNGNPYSLTKRECISEVEKMRDAALAAQTDGRTE